MRAALTIAAIVTTPPPTESVAFGAQVDAR